MSAAIIEQVVRWHVESLFLYDDRERMRFVREPGYVEPDLDPAPRVYLHRSPNGNTWRVRSDLPDDLVAEIDALCRSEPTLPLPPREADRPRINDAMIALLERHAPVRHVHRGPTWWLPVQPHIPSTTKLVTPDTAAVLLGAHFSGRLHSPAGWERGGLAASIEDGVAVALCFCARVIEQAAEAGVETVEAFRGRGHARAAVACWAESMRAQGRLPLYSTAWENVASRRVAAALDAVAYGEDWSLN